VIKALSIKNFKSFQDSGKIEIKPIMLLIGPNSSGKTSFIQFLLAIKQTLESRAKENPILINGRYVELGTFRDLIFSHDDSNELEFDFYVETKDLDKEIFTILEQSNEDIEYLHNYLLNEIQSDYVDILNILNDKLYEIPQIKERVKNTDLSLLRLNILISWEKSERKMVLSEYKIYDKNDTLLVKVNNDIIHLFIQDKPVTDIELKLSNLFFEEIIVKHYSPFQEFKTYSYIEFSMIFNSLSRDVVKAFSKFFDNIYYLGPLREYPKRHYLASGEVHHDVGFRGEFFVDVLYRTTLEENKANNLLKSLNNWMKKFNLAYEIKLSEITQENIYSLVLVDPYSKIPVNITDVGFGVSQVLPILVEGFHLKPGSTIIVEQPEIHLHPRVQAELGDLFIEFYKEGKFSIIETHSEHLILRIQRRIAEGKIKNSDVGIYYFEPTKNGTRIIEMEIDEMGMIKNWPRGFFEDDFVESYKHIEAIVEKSRKETTQ
jgi:predicted ATPase